MPPKRSNTFGGGVSKRSPKKSPKKGVSIPVSPQKEDLRAPLHEAIMEHNLGNVLDLKLNLRVSQNAGNRFCINSQLALFHSLKFNSGAQIRALSGDTVIQGRITFSDAVPINEIRVSAAHLAHHGLQETMVHLSFTRTAACSEVTFHARDVSVLERSLLTAKLLYFDCSGIHPFTVGVFETDIELTVEGFEGGGVISPDSKISFTTSVNDDEAVEDDLQVIRGVGVTTLLDKCKKLITCTKKIRILVLGAAGNGKTLFLEHIAAELRTELFDTSLLSRMNQNATEVPKTEGVLLVDNIHLFAPSQKDLTPSAAFLVRQNSLVCTAPKVTDVNDALVAAFDLVLHIPMPNTRDRALIIESLANVPLDEAQRLAEVSQGFVPKDIQRAVFQAALDEDADLEGVFARTSPLNLAALVVDIPNVQWEDIGGSTQHKQILEEIVEMPLAEPERFLRLGITPPRGLLLFGPPGCSKTMLAKAVACQTRVNFIPVRGPELFDKYVGESERKIRDLFTKARQSSPCIIFFDEFDSLAGNRSRSSNNGVGERIIATLLNEMDGMQPAAGVMFIGATNRPDLIDTALLRPGRLDRIVYVGLPDPDARGEILDIYMRKMPVINVDRDVLVTKTDGWTGAELMSLTKEAAMVCLRDRREEVSMQDFETALQSITPQVTDEMVAFFDGFNSSRESAFC
ncbi:hypothetical protein PCE1_000034 [Barthelona sp. PCE]